MNQTDGLFGALRRLFADKTGAAVIRNHFAAQLREQADLAAAHLRDPYWTDSRTGHNIAKDEFAAVTVMEAILRKSDEEFPRKAKPYAQWLLDELGRAEDHFRANVPDPDGYGIATIGTVARNVAQFCRAAGCDIPDRS